MRGATTSHDTNVSTCLPFTHVCPPHAGDYYLKAFEEGASGGAFGLSQVYRIAPIDEDEDEDGDLDPHVRRRRRRRRLFGPLMEVRVH